MLIDFSKFVLMDVCYFICFSTIKNKSGQICLIKKVKTDPTPEHFKNINTVVKYFFQCQIFLADYRAVTESYSVIKNKSLFRAA